MKTQQSTDPPLITQHTPPLALRRKSKPAVEIGGHGPPKRVETVLQITYLSLKVVEAVVTIFR